MRASPQTPAQGGRSASPSEVIPLRKVLGCFSFKLTVGSLSDWSNVPETFQADLAALDKLEDEALLELKQERDLSEAEVSELARLRKDADRFMLRRAHAAALLRWRGHNFRWFIVWQSIFRAYQRQKR